MSAQALREVKPWWVTACFIASTVITTSTGYAQTAKQYPPLADYLMPRDAEMALAKSAAPANISSRATIEVLSESGYEVVHKGENGFVCLVMRGWTAPTYTPVQFRDLVYDPTLRAPICFDPEAVRVVMPYYELRTRLGMARKSPEEIAEGIQLAYAKGGYCQLNSTINKISDLGDEMHVSSSG
jgi:hypothetical protein